MIIVPVGTRAELIKMSTIVLELEKRGLDYSFINLNQHPLADTIESLDLPGPHVTVEKNLREEWSRSHALGLRSWYNECVRAVGKIYAEAHGRRVILGHGNTFGMDIAMRVGSSGGKRDTSVHVEAGVRAFFPVKPDFKNWRRGRFADMMYRRGDVRADVNVAVAKSSVKNLKQEETRGRILYTQDPMADVVAYALSCKPSERPPKGPFITANATRSLDSRPKVENMIDALKSTGVPAFCTLINPKIEKRLRSCGVWHPFLSTIAWQKNLDYVSFIHHASKARAVITDSNGTQEECAALKRPCIVTNDFAQFPELVAGGAVRVTGCDRVRLKKALHDAKNGFPTVKIGDGRATARIVNELRRLAE